MTLNETIRIKGRGIEIDILVSPRSNRSGIEGVDEWRNRTILKVKAPPLDGRANKEVEEILSEITGSRASVVSGQTSRQKTVFIEGDPETILSKLERSNE